MASTTKSGYPLCAVGFLQVDAYTTVLERYESAVLGLVGRPVAAQTRELYLMQVGQRQVK